MYAIRKIISNKEYSDSIAKTLYNKALEQARLPVFFLKLGVPDTVDGRFDLLVLHIFLIIFNLKAIGKDGLKLSQSVFDLAFKDFDSALREMGIGDLGVPRHMKRMMEGFHGRCCGYEQALVQENSPDALCETITRNLYGSVSTPPDKILDLIAVYMHSSLSLLAGTKLLEGQVEFPNPWPE